MGIGTSKQRVRQHLTKSQNFTTACTTVFWDLQTLTQDTSPGHIFPYQVSDAATRLHTSLTVSVPVPLIKTWCPNTPARTQVDGAYKSLGLSSDSGLNYDEFKEFSVVLFTDAVVMNATKAVGSRVGLGLVGIAGVGMLARVGGVVVASFIGLYALGVATSVYLSLG